MISWAHSVALCDETSSEKSLDRLVVVLQRNNFQLPPLQVTLKLQQHAHASSRLISTILSVTHDL